MLKIKEFLIYKWDMVKLMKGEKSPLYFSLLFNFWSFVILGALNICVGNFFTVVLFSFFYIALIHFNIVTFQDGIEMRRLRNEMFATLRESAGLPRVTVEVEVSNECDKEK